MQRRPDNGVRQSILEVVVEQLISQSISVEGADPCLINLIAVIRGGWHAETDLVSVEPVHVDVKVGNVIVAEHHDTAGALPSWLHGGLEKWGVLAHQCFVHMKDLGWLANVYENLWRREAAAVLVVHRSFGIVEDLVLDRLVGALQDLWDLLR